MQHLYLIRGLHGTGKTTLGERICEDIGATGRPTILIEADQFFMELNNGFEQYKFDRRYLGAAHDECFGRTMRYLKAGYTVAVANTFSTKRELLRYFDGLKRTGLNKIVDTQVIKCERRFTSIHGVPRKATEKMAERWENFDGEIVWNGNLGEDQ